jgi:Fe-S-cluster containining protein
MEMKLNVLPEKSQAWYADGLRFTCTQCGNCCTGEPGYIWISIEEVQRLGAHLKTSPQEIIDRYCRKIDGKLSLRERRNSRGEHDCIFLEEQRVAQRLPDGQHVTQTRRVCTIYPARPLQCRTWPFWSENLQDESRWKRAARRCPGMNSGKSYTFEQIVALRDARDWPHEPPTSVDAV